MTKFSFEVDWYDRYDEDENSALYWEVKADESHNNTFKFGSKVSERPSDDVAYVNLTSGHVHYVFRGEGSNLIDIDGMPSLKDIDRARTRVFSYRRDDSEIYWVPPANILPTDLNGIVANFSRWVSHETLEWRWETCHVTCHAFDVKLGSFTINRVPSDLSRGEKEEIEKRCTRLAKQKAVAKLATLKEADNDE